MQGPIIQALNFKTGLLQKLFQLSPALQAYMGLIFLQDKVMLFENLYQVAGARGI